MTPTQPFLGDHSIGLHALERSDLPLAAEARNNTRVRLRTREMRGLNMLDQERWFESITSKSTRNFMFKIVVTAPAIQQSPEAVAVGIRELDSHFAGVVGLCHWEPRDQTAETSFYLTPRFERHGVMTKALGLLHAWGFDELNLERIWAEVYAFNTPCLELLGKIGFRQEGILRSHVFRQGKRHDSHMMGLLRSQVVHGHGVGL